VLRYGLTLQEQTPAHCSEDITTSRSSYSSESRFLLSALTISASGACILTRFSSLSRLNVIHGHIPISRSILHLSPPFITPMIPSSLEGLSIQTRRWVAPCIRFMTLTFYLRSSAENRFQAHIPDTNRNPIPGLSIVRCTTRIIPQDQHIISARSNPNNEEIAGLPCDRLESLHLTCRGEVQIDTDGF
jgi:hypothetical protein